VLAGILAIIIWQKNKTRRVTYLRNFSRIVSLVFIYWLFTINIWLALILIVIYAATIVTGRFFCGWICPFGFYMDIESIVREKLGIGHRNLPDKINSALNKLRYFILLFFLLLPFYLDFSKMNISTFFWYFLGPYKPLTILVSPIQTLLVPWVAGPLELTGYAMSISYPYLSEIKYYATGIPYADVAGMLTFLVITLSTSFIVRRFWCRFCPTGASFSIINKFKVFQSLPLMHISKDEEKCTKCGICKRVCPNQVTEIYDKKGGNIKTSMCMLCLRCVEMCPYQDTLKVQLINKTVFKSRNWLEPAKNE
jgi:ferredoxin-type protein NapH